MNLIIRNVRLIDGTGADPVPHMSLEVTNGVISWIGEETPRPRKHLHQEDINGEGLTLIPGMIDCHEHFTGDGGMDNMDHLLGDTAETFTLKAASNARRALMSGVTSARDVVPASESTFASLRIRRLGPFLAPVSWPPGSGSSSTEPGLPAAPDAPRTWRPSYRDPRDDRSWGTPREGGGHWVQPGRRSVWQPWSAGARCGGADCTRGRAEDSRPLRRVRGHSPGCEAGIDSVEHGSFVDEETVQLMAQRGTYLVPTMSTWDARARVGSMLGTLTKEDLADVEYRRENSKASFRRALKAGVKIAAGSDAGGSPARHGFLAREIELMVESGMTPKAALESATREGATLMGIEDQTGTIEVGKQADMVLIDGDPLSDPGALRNVWGVFLGGRRVL